MGTKTRSQTKKAEIQHVEIIDDDDDEEEVKTPPTPPTPPPENKKQQDRTQKSEQQTSSSTAYNRAPTKNSKYFPKVITTPPTSNLKSLISAEENNARYDLPDELKVVPLTEEIIPVSSSSSAVASSSNSNGKRPVQGLFKNSILSDDDSHTSEEDVPISKKKKPNKSSEIVEPILISSVSDIQSIPDDEEIISTKVTVLGNSKEKTNIENDNEEKSGSTVNVEVITSSPSKKDPIDIKIEKWNDEWKQISENYRISRHNLFEEVIDELKKEWSLKEENKSRFKQGLEMAGKLMSNDSQKARLFFLTLSYYIVFEKKDIQLIGTLFDSLTGNLESNPLLVSVDFSSIEFEIVCKEYADKKDILTLLKKYHSLSLIEKLKQTCTDDQTIARFGQLSKIINHQHCEIAKYQSKEKKQ